MIKTLFTLLSLTISTQLIAQETVVFQSGKDGYASYRIPAIVKNKTGELIAFSEGRVEHAGDYGNVDIVYKISKDEGKTWETLQIAVDYEKLQAGNPAPVVDLLDPNYPNGRIFLFYNTGNNHEEEVRKGKGLRETWFITSSDGAKTWSEPTNITMQVHRPNQPSINQAYQFKEDWRTYANTPGHGFQFVSGPQQGRLYIAANHSAGNPQTQGKDWNAHAFYSDDHGQSFKLSENIPFPGSNESIAAQIDDQAVYMSSRNQQINPKQRIISISRDGGHAWESAKLDPNLPDPINQASVLSWKKGKKFILAHLNAADPIDRNNLTLRLSKDQGKTWYFNKLIAKAPEGFKGAYSAYSDLVLLNKKTVGILYEKNNYRDIVFSKESIK
ncbi:sialidase family protein [Sphingobacterium sp. HJSM2_6]|uniref:sialidase family protein n=1 Tax=Sphingobacterium sp. HJSM2_6 TaxID=3366264 RepID=UPI003BBC21A8